jgi:hypothetical protein
LELAKRVSAWSVGIISIPRVARSGYTLMRRVLIAAKFSILSEVFLGFLQQRFYSVITTFLSVLVYLTKCLRIVLARV